MQLSLQLSKLQDTTSYFDENVGRVGVKSDTVGLCWHGCQGCLAPKEFQDIIFSTHFFEVLSSNLHPQALFYRIDGVLQFQIPNTSPELCTNIIVKKDINMI